MRRRSCELLRLKPEASMREGYVMALRNAVDDYVRAIVHDVATTGESVTR